MIAQPQGMGGEVQPAKGVEPQAPAQARLRKGPDGQGRVEGLRRGHCHGGVGEGHLKDQHQVRPLGRQRLERRTRGLGIEEQRARSDDPMVGRVQGGEGLCQGLLGESDIEGGPPERQNADGLTHEAPPKSG